MVEEVQVIIIAGIAVTQVDLQWLALGIKILTFVL